MGDTCIIEKKLGTGGCAGDRCLASMTRLTDARLVLTARICSTARDIGGKVSQFVESCTSGGGSRRDILDAYEKDLRDHGWPDLWRERPPSSDAHVSEVGQL